MYYHESKGCLGELSTLRLFRRVHGGAAARHEIGATTGLLSMHLKGVVVTTGAEEGTMLGEYHTQFFSHRDVRGTVWAKRTFTVRAVGSGREEWVVKDHEGFHAARCVREHFVKRPNYIALREYFAPVIASTWFGVFMKPPT
jgi:hypothetical protein